MVLLLGLISIIKAISTDTD